MPKSWWQILVENTVSFFNSFIKNAAITVDMLTEGFNNDDMVFVNTFFFTLYATARFWFNVFLAYPFQSTPGFMRAAIKYPQIVWATYVLAFSFFFSFFFLTKRRITMQRLHSFFYFTIVFISLGFAIVFSVSLFFDMRRSSESEIIQELIQPLNSTPMHTEYMLWLIQYLWKFLSATLLLVLWTLLLYNKNPEIFTKFKTVKFPLWFFNYLTFFFLIWAATSNPVLVLLITEFVAFFVLCNIYVTRESVIARSNDPFVIFFIVIKLVLLCLLIFLKYYSPYYPNSYLKNFNLLFVICCLWYYSWDYAIKANLAAKEATNDSFINSFLRTWLLFNFFILVPYTGNALIFIAFIPVVVYSSDVIKEFTAIPNYAWPRLHKVVMFGEAPVATEPKHIIENAPFNSNVYFMINNFSNVVFSFTPLLVAATPKTNQNFVYITLVLFSVLVWFLYFTGAQLDMHFKTSDVLDWRGLFLSVHQYNWAMKYTLVVFITMSVTYSFWTFSILHQLVHSSDVSFIFVGCILMFLAVYMYVGYRLYFLWSRIFAHFQPFTYEYWTDKFWTELSPFMRDFVYWRPIEPEDAEEVDPNFYGFTNKAAPKGLMLIFVYLAVMYFFVNVETLADANIALFMWSYKTWVIYYLISKIFKLYNFDENKKEVQALQDFAWYECGTHLLSMVLMVACIYLTIVHVWLGLFWLLFFFTK